MGCPCARSPAPLATRQTSLNLSAHLPLPSSASAASGWRRTSPSFNLAVTRFGTHNRSQRPLRATDKETEDKQASSSSRPEPPPAPPGPAAGPSSQQQEEESPDKQMEKFWKDIKVTAKQNLSEEEAVMLDKIQLKDVETGEWARKLAAEQLGPVLAAIGVDEDPLDFFVDVVKTLLFMQLISVGSLFYSAELLWHNDTGEAFRAASGLTLGYVLRPFFKVEQLLHPLYNWSLGLFFPNVTYEISKPSSEEAQSTLNRLSILIAAAYFLPQAALHWHASECTQLVGPLALGMLLFDVLFMVTLLLKLRML